MADSSAIKQLNNESIDQFISQFKKARNICLVPLHEKMLAAFAFNGLKFTTRKRMVGQTFDDIF